MGDHLLIEDVQRKIKREEKLIQGAMMMRNSTQNTSVQAQADNQIRESRRNIEYFEKTLRDVQMRRTSQGVGNLSLDPGGGSASSAGRPSTSSQARTGGSTAQSRSSDPPQLSATFVPGGLGFEDTEYGDLGSGGYSGQLDAGNGTMPAQGPFTPPPPGTPVAKIRPNYSRLDLIKYDTPHLGPRIQVMLSQLEFKLSVEKQYKAGVEKIMGSYSVDGDKRIRQEALGRRIESMQKIELLKRALKRYEDLHVDVESATDPTDDDSINGPSMRKPLTGLLSIRIHAVSDVNHTASGRLSKGPETFIIMKVEDEFKGRTKATRSDRWMDELHEIEIDKGNEVELTVYDKTGNDHPLPIGMLWIRMSDIVEEMRRKKIEAEFNNAGWVSADKTMADGKPSRPDMQFNAPPGGQGAVGQSSGFGDMNQMHSGQVWIESWFSLEPVGRIQLSLSFAKETRERRPFDAGLNRKGAIRQRKEDVHELYGHKFVAQQFYNIMRCALCGELLKYAVGFQCADCKYMCHEKCYPQVVTKCISKSNAESDPDEAKLNHRIPHRFEAYGNMGANWCCHCGYILPLGRKNVRRCKECKLCCHAHCTHLVPDFCGMSMKDANRILEEMRRAYAKQGGSGGSVQPVRTLRGPGREPKPRPQPAAAPSYISTDFDSGSGLSSLKERYSYGNDQAPEVPATQTPAMVQSRSTGTSREAAKAIFNATQPQSQPNQRNPQERKPVGPIRTESSYAAQAAANALAGKRTTTERPPIPQTRSSTGYDRPSQPSQHAPYVPQAYAEVDQPFQQSPAPTPQPPQARPVVPPAQEQSKAAVPTAQAQSNSVMQFVERREHPVQAKQQGSGRRIGLDHFNFLAVLGKGNFGKVMLAETKATKQLYAIKVLKKEFIIENDEVESTKSERDVFIIANKARHPFLTNLHACFQTETRVYFVMEYISGGDLMLHIQRGQFGTKRAQFYAAEVCLALKYFHENGVVYRDLKLDNIMLTLDGHIKVADYGLCKKDMYYGSTTSTFCGTPEFMAPEILLDKKYGRAVDWWAFGVLIYQMLLQQSPFRGEDEDEIYDAILADEPLYPIHMPRDSVSILQQLLTRDPAERLGSGPTDAQEVMSHAFFRNVNWQDIADKKVAPPFLPQIKSATDTSNFDSEFTSVTPVLTPVQSVLSQAMQEEFRGFSYSADFV